MDLYVGLYTFVIRTPQGWRFGTETCRSLICCKQCTTVHMLDDILILIH